MPAKKKRKAKLPKPLRVLGKLLEKEDLLMAAANEAAELHEKKCPHGIGCPNLVRNAGVIIINAINAERAASDLNEIDSSIVDRFTAACDAFEKRLGLDRVETTPEPAQDPPAPVVNPPKAQPQAEQPKQLLCQGPRQPRTPQDVIAIMRGQFDRCGEPATMRIHDGGMGCFEAAPMCAAHAERFARQTFQQINLFGIRLATEGKLPPSLDLVRKMFVRTIQ